MNKRERCMHNLFTRIQVELGDRVTVKGSKQCWLIMLIKIEGFQVKTSEQEKCRHKELYNVIIKGSIPPRNHRNS